MIQSAQPSLGRSTATIGSKLRAAREDKGWTLDDLSVRTRIPARHLETIEAGRSADLPGGFIGKSFVRQYAQTVGLDAEQVLREFIAQTGINLEVPFEERKISPYTPESLQRFQSRVWRNLAFAAVGILLVIVSAVYALRRSPSPDNGRGKAQPAAGESGSTVRPYPDPVTPASNSQDAPSGLSKTPTAAGVVPTSGVLETTSSQHSAVNGTIPGGERTSAAPPTSIAPSSISKPVDSGPGNEDRSKVEAETAPAFPDTQNQ